MGTFKPYIIGRMCMSNVFCDNVFIMLCPAPVLPMEISLALTVVQLRSNALVFLH